MSALPHTSLPDLTQVAETMLHECMPAGWDWDALDHVTQRTPRLSEVNTLRNAKRIFSWAVLNVCGVLEAYKAKSIKGSRFAGRKKAAAIMGVTLQTVENIYRAANGIGDDTRISDEAKRAAIQFATRLLLSEKRTYGEATAEFELKLVCAAIVAAGGYQHKAAYGLGIHRNTIAQILGR